MRNGIKPLLVLWGMGFAVAIAVGEAAAAGASNAAFAPEREILLPLEDLSVVLESGTRRVMMPRSEYEALRRKARRVEEQRPPVGAVLTSADYVVEVSDERAVIRGKLGLDVIDKGLHMLPLDLSGVGLLDAQLDGDGAQLGRQGGQNVVVFVSEIGSHVLTLEATTPLQTTAAQQVLDFQVPVPPSTRLHITLPGDVEIRGGASVIKRVFDEGAGETRMELLAKPGRMSLVMTLNSRLKRQERVVVARSVFVEEVSQAYERLHATISLDVLHRAVRDFLFRVPAGFEVTGVESPAMSRWVMRNDPAGQILDVQLREDTTGTVVIGISAVRASPDLENWSMAFLEPLDVVGHVAVAGVLLEERLKAHEVTSDGLIAVDRDVLLRALPKSVVQADAGEARVRPLLAYYAPQPAFRLSARFARLPAQFTVTTSLLLTLQDGGMNMRGGFGLRASEEALFAFDFEVPNAWRIDEIADPEGKPQPFERYAGKTAGNDRVRVRLGHPIADGEEKTIFFSATLEPAGWFDDWQRRDVAFPAFLVDGALRDIGAIAVDVQDDLRARATALDALTPLDENEKTRYGMSASAGALAYRYESRPYAATLQVTRNAPRLTAETYSFLRVERGMLTAHYELIYDVTEARARNVRMSFPASTPAVLAVRGLQGTQLKEYVHHKDADGRQVWDVSLADARRDPIHLAVDFEMPTGESDTLELPLVRAEGVAYQSGLVAVEGSAELDVRVIEHPRRVDVGELAAADYQPGRRLLGAYGFVGEPAPVRAVVSDRAAYRLPPAIVKRAELTTRFSDNGTSQSSAVFHLRTKASYVDVELPDRSVLWSAMLNGTPARPQQKNERILIGLPAGRLDADLQLVYETPVDAVRVWNRLDMPAPRLFLHEEEDGPRLPVPMTDLLWYVDIPTGFRVVSSAGTVVSDGVRPTPPAAVALARWLYRTSGGIGPRRGLVGGCVSMFGLAAMRSRKMAAAEYTYDQEQTMAQMTDDAGVMLDLAGEAKDESRGRKRESRKGKQVKTGKGLPSWAVEGARSLEINVSKSGSGMTFRSLGRAPRLRVSLVSRRRLEAMAWAAGMATFLLGVFLAGASRRRRSVFVIAVLLVSTVLPALPGLQGLAIVLNAAFYAAFCLLLFFALAALVTPVGRRRKHARRNGKTAATATAAVLFALLAFPGMTRAGERAAPRNRPEDESESFHPVEIPESAVLVPYGDKPSERDRVMVPYQRLLELWRLAHPPTNGVDRPKVAYSLAGITYKGTIEDDDVLSLRCLLSVSVHVDDYVTLPLPLAGAVLVRASVNGAPARLGTVPGAPAPTKQAPARQQKGARVRPVVAGGSVLYLQGKGRHEVDLTMRVRLARQGGWRVARATIPVAPAASLEIRVPHTGTEVTFAGVSDRKSYRTGVDDERIRTPLNADGRLDLRWRPRISEGDVDRTLTAESTAVFDLQEDHLRLVWMLALQFRRGEYEQFSVELPREYLVERVSGTNVRGWQVEEGGATGKRLTVVLLQQAKEEEKFVMDLWRPGRVAGAGLEEVPVPRLVMPNAIRHTGRLTVRRSPLLDVRTVSFSGLRRTDLAAGGLGLPADAVRDRSPLGVRPYQSYEFMSTAFELTLQVESDPANVRGSVQSVFRMAERERSIESRINLSIKGRPILRVRVRVPDDLEISGISAPGTSEWVKTETAGGQIVTIHFAAGLTGEVPIVIRGRLGETRALNEVAIPRLALLDVDEQPGDMVVQADPAFDVQAQSMTNISSVLMRRVHGWLKPAQRPFARLALHYDRPDYGGRLVLVPREPDVTSYTVTNVRVTDRAVEETILIDFTIRNAGVRRVEFSLPAVLSDARINAPLLRQKTVTPAPGGKRVDVMLELQDEVMNQLRVLVESDRLLTGDARRVELPLVKTGRAGRRYLSLESAGRDEVVLEETGGMEAVDREQKAWARVSALLRGGTTRAFVAAAGETEPGITFRTRQRAAVATAGARIGLARTLVIVDPAGTYRASQTYRVDNRTEQFLDIALPPGAMLWTARVAGEYVKPVVPDAAPAGKVRIPLVKTAAGDLDYLVAVKYGGRIDGLKHVGRTDFPLIRTQNINVELSQVTLRLPMTHRWFNFDGTMRRVEQAGDFEAGVLAYKNKLTERLVHTLKFGNPFEKARATSNLKQLTKSLEDYQQTVQVVNPGNQKLNIEISNVSGVIANANKELAQFEEEQQDDSDSLDNRWRMNDVFDGQVNNFARNVVFNNGANWTDTGVQQAGQVTTNTAFINDWLSDNSLSMVDREAVSSNNRIQVWEGQGKMAQAEKAAAEQQIQAGQQFALFNQPQANGDPLGRQTAANAASEGLLRERTGQGRGGRYRSQKQLAQQYQQKLERQGGQTGLALQQNRGEGEMLESPRQPPPVRVPGPQAPMTVDAGTAGVAAGGEDLSTVVAGVPDAAITGSGRRVDREWGEAAAGLASLDVDFPGPDHSRWAEYRFTTPRGEIEIRAVTAAGNAIDSYQRGGLALALLLFAGVVRTVARKRERRSFWSSRSAGTMLIIAGVLGLFVGILPVAGVVAVVLGIVLRRRAARAAA